MRPVWIIWNTGEHYDALGETVVYTGTIDAYYQYQFGKLEYRSLRFESEVLNEENHQGGCRGQLHGP